jgi:hypothetical protein
MMPDASWKRFERETARILGVERYKRGADFSKEMPDIVAPASNLFKKDKRHLIVECKYRKTIGIIDYYNRNKTEEGLYLTDTKSNINYILFDLSTPPIKIPKTRIYIKRIVPSYIISALKQAKEYSSFLGKDEKEILAAACFAQKNKKTKVFVIEEKDLIYPQLNL